MCHRHSSVGRWQLPWLMQKHELPLRRRPFSPVSVWALKRKFILFQAVPGHCLRRSYRPWGSKHISTARVGNQYTKRTLSHRKTGERSEHLSRLWKKFSQSIVVWVAVLVHKQRTFAVQSIRKQQSGEDPNEAIFILKCEMDLSKSGSDHYSNHVNVNRGKLHFSGCCNSKWIRLDVQRILSLGLIAFAVACS